MKLYEIYLRMSSASFYKQCYHVFKFIWFCYNITVKDGNIINILLYLVGKTDGLL